MSSKHERAKHHLEGLRQALREMPVKHIAEGERPLEAMFSRTLDTIGFTIGHHADMEEMEQNRASLKDPVDG